MRKLIYVPLVHAEADLGSLADRVRQEYGSAWAVHASQVQRYWEEVGDALLRLHLEWDKVKIYHDSLVTEGDQGKRMVRELAARGSPDFALVDRLLARGARLVQTEDVALLLEEYRLVKSRGRANQAELARVLRERDVYVARRIDETLGAEEVGILFMGVLHGVVDLLPPDIQVTVLPRPRS